MARLPAEYLERVLAATDIAEVVGHSIALKRQGPTEFVGLCPFHKDGSPSLNVNPGKGVFLCRSCGESGNAFTFIQRHEGLSFRDAVEECAKAAGLPLPREIDGSDPAEFAKHERLLQLLDAAHRLYRDALSKHEVAQNYLRERGITPEMAHAFGLGYAPPGRTYLGESMVGVTPEIMVEAGITLESSFAPGQYVDFMSDRIIFPIRNSSGRTIAFGGRSLDPGAKRKYLNSPETPLFKKGAELYGQFEASRAIQKTKTVIVTEGYVDVVIPHGHGITNVVGAMGVALQPATIAKLFKSADTILYCFDGDNAGRNAARKAMHLTAPLVDERKRCRFAFLPEGLDLDDFVKREAPDAVQRFFAGSEPLSKYAMREFSAQHDMESVEGRAGFAADAMQFIDSINSPTIKGLMTNLVQDAIGGGIALPASRNVASPPAQAGAGPVHPAAPPPVSIHPTPSPTSGQLKPGFAPAPRASRAAPASEMLETPSMAARVMGILMREPQAANHFDASWLEVVPVPAHEIESVAAVIRFVDERGSHVTANDIVRHFAGTPVGEFIRSTSVGSNVSFKNENVAKVHAFMNLLAGLDEQPTASRSMSPRP
ncbi:DNA primase [Variovorax sp. LT1P1]|uniref:DNA primase n=1 Tax=Variovorax sp. LT1P1 TaxID=3443730 RepID=UPI003F46E8B6